MYSINLDRFTKFTTHRPIYHSFVHYQVRFTTLTKQSYLSLSCTVSTSIDSLYLQHTDLFITLLYSINFERFNILRKQCPIYLSFVQYQLRYMHYTYNTLSYLSLFCTVTTSRDSIYSQSTVLFISLLYSINFDRFTKVTTNCHIYHSFVQDRNQQIR